MPPRILIRGDRGRRRFNGNSSGNQGKPGFVIRSVCSTPVCLRSALTWHGPSFTAVLKCVLSVYDNIVAVSKLSQFVDANFAFILNRGAAILTCPSYNQNLFYEFCGVSCCLNRVPPIRNGLQQFSIYFAYLWRMTDVHRLERTGEDFTPSFLVRHANRRDFLLRHQWF